MGGTEERTQRQRVELKERHKDSGRDRRKDAKTEVETEEKTQRQWAGQGANVIQWGNGMCSNVNMDSKGVVEKSRECVWPR